MTPSQAAEIAQLLNERNQLTVAYDTERVLATAANFEFETRDGRVVACVERRRVQWYQWEICHLSTRMEWESKGVAYAVYKLATDCALTHGALILQCTIREGNDASERFFSRQGFRKVARFYHKESGKNVGVWMNDLAPARGDKATPDEGPSLAAFIEQNHKLISALGIFTALTVFARALPIAFLGHLLSFFFLAATVILWFELLEKYPPKTRSLKLRLFETALTMAILFLLACWLFIYWDFWRQMLVAVIFGVLSLIVSGLFQKYDVFNRVFTTKAGGRKWLRRFVFFLTIGVTLTATLLVAGAIGIKVTPWLDQIQAKLKQIH